MRKHLYLITEHEQSDHVGHCKILGSRLSYPLKNEEAPLTTFNKETGEFKDVGKAVGLGYADFESESEFTQNIGDAVREKLAEIDDEYLIKVGKDPAEYPDQ